MEMNHRICIKALKSKLFDDANGFRAVAYYEADGSPSFWITSEQIGVLPEPELAATVVALERCVERLPEGIVLFVASDLDAFYNAIGGLRYLDRWERNGFGGKLKNPETWRSLCATRDARRLTLHTVKPNDLPMGESIFKDVVLRAQGKVPKHRLGDPSDVVDEDPWTPDDADMLLQRALDRDP